MVQECRSFCALIGLLALLVGCSYDSPQTPESVLNLLDAGEAAKASVAAQVMSDREPEDPIPHLLLSIAAFHQGSVDVLDRERQTAIGDSASLQRVLGWIDALPSRTPTATRLFLRAVAAQARGQSNDALTWYRKAADCAGQVGLLYADCAIALDPSSGYSASIPVDAPIVYTGRMRVEHHAWVPTEGEFHVSSGSLFTSLGNTVYEAEFGGWTYSKSKEGSDTLSWAPQLTSGRLLVTTKNSASGTVDGGVTLMAAGDCAKHPFDFMGKYRLITIDASRKEAFPMIIVLFGADAGTWKPQAFLANKLVVKPDDLLRRTRLSEGSVVALSQNATTLESAVPIKMSYTECGDGLCISEQAHVLREEGKVLVGFSAERGRELWFGGDVIKLMVQDGKMWGVIR